MSVEEYSLKLNQLSRYSPTVVADLRVKMSKFVTRISDMVVKEWGFTMLIDYINIFHYIIHAQQNEEKKLKEKSTKVKFRRSHSN